MNNSQTRRAADEIVRALEEDYFKLELPKKNHWDYLKARVYDYKQAVELERPKELRDALDM